MSHSRSPESDFALVSQQNTPFYNINQLHVVPRINIKKRTGLRIARPLPTENSEEQKPPKQFLCLTEENRHVKLLVCTDKRSAKRTVRNIGFAVEHNLPTARVISRIDELIILEYTPLSPVKSLTRAQVIELGIIHARMNIPLRHITLHVRVDLARMIEDCIALLKDAIPLHSVDSLAKKVMQLFPTLIIPVFDHQSLNFDTLSFTNTGQLWINDESAFGIMPFGYTLERAMYGPSGYMMCTSREEREVYFGQFSTELQDYYTKTRQFWQLLLGIRTAARSVMNGFSQDATALLQELSVYFDEK